MKFISQVKVVVTLVTVCFAGFAMANDSADSQANDWSPYSFGSSSDSLASSLGGSDYSRAVPLYSDEFASDYLNTKSSDALSIGLEDASDGLWKFSLDLNKSQEALFTEEQYRLNAAYSPDGDNSTFYINYGNRRVPVSIKVDDFLDYNQAEYHGSDLALGFEQKMNDGWAVSISYTKSELEQTASDNSIFGFDQNLATNQQYWFDLNRDGLPEAVNLFSELGVSSNFEKAFDGIEIRLTRQVSDQLFVGGSFNKTDSDFDWQPYQLNDLETTESELSERGLSIFSHLNFTSQWSLDAQLSHKDYQQQSPQIVSLVTDNADKLDFDSTTLDIGVQYQGRWDDMGLVIRIDLVNLLGAGFEQDRSQNFNDTGLAPYTFQTPKYIKLSGSINF